MKLLEEMKEYFLQENGELELRKWISDNMPQYYLSKIKPKNPKMELGVFCEFATNPVSGYEYQYETGGELKTIARKNNWCAQYAGKAQWQSVGRFVKENEEPYTYKSIYKKDINLYAFEQTEEY